MRTGKQLLVASREYAKENRPLSWWCLGSTLAIFAAAIAVTCLDLPWWWRLPFSLLAGLVLVRLFVLYHDFQHGAILKGSRLANWIMTIYGLFTLNPPSIWNRSHNHHHKHNAKIFGAEIGSFPVMTVEAWTQAGPGRRLAYRVARHPMTIALGYLSVFFYGMCIRSLINNPKLHRDSALAIALHVALIAVVAVIEMDDLMLAVLAPSAIAAAAGSYLFYAQHNFPDVKLQSRADWDYVTAALKSSSYIRMSRLMHWFTGNIGYHHVHHLNHKIPFYRLPETMDALAELQNPGTTSLRPRDIIRCLRLKLWDPQRDRLVSFAEARIPVASSTSPAIATSAATP